MVKYLRLDTDLDPLRDDPRFEALVVRTEERAASSGQAVAQQAAVAAGPGLTTTAPLEVSARTP